MFTIAKQFHFSASHMLKGLPKGHPCGRLHGHNYVVEVILASEELDMMGFVVDYGELSDVGRFIDDTLDHRHLNDVMPVNPTAENIAEFLFHAVGLTHPQIVAVRVSETPKTWAEYRR